MSAIDRVLGASVSARLIRHTHRPVVLVPDTAVPTKLTTLEQTLAAAMANCANDFDRVLSVAKAIQRRFGHRLEAGLAQGVRCLCQHQMVVSRQPQQLLLGKRLILMLAQSHAR